MTNRNVEKGKAFERRVAQHLTDALGYRFFRSVVNSTVAMHEDRRIYGDVICDNPQFPFCIECKSYGDFSIESVLLGILKQFFGFWTQAVKQADDAGLVPMLCVTNSKRSYAFVPESTFSSWPNVNYVVIHHAKYGDIVGMEFTAFVQHLKETI